MSNIMPFTGNVMTMTLKEITDLLNVRHDKAMLKVGKMADEPSFGAMSKMDIVYNEYGQTVETCVLDKRQSLAVAARLNTALLMRVIDRWQELEQKFALPDFSNPAEAARAWIKQYEERQIIEGQRDEAIAKKAEIGARREATAMATASVATRKVKKLEEELGVAEKWKQTKAISWLPEVFEVTKVVYQQAGKRLTAISLELDIAPLEIEDSQYGKVKAYHIDVIDEFYKRLSTSPEIMAKYRKSSEAA